MNQDSPFRDLQNDVLVYIIVPDRFLYTSNWLTLATIFMLSRNLRKATLRPIIYKMKAPRHLKRNLHILCVQDCWSRYSEKLGGGFSWNYRSWKVVFFRYSSHISPCNFLQFQSWISHGTKSICLLYLFYFNLCIHDSTS